MKKNIAVIYRLAFILFSIWAILESVSFNVLELPVKLLNFTVFSDAVCLLCILLVFIFTLRRNIGKGLYFFKTACAFLALLALAANLPLVFAISSSGWILKVLLPLMMLVDHFVFDSNGKIKFWQMLLWLLLAGFVAWLIYVIADKFLNLSDSLGLLGLFGNLSELIDILANALVLTAVVYLLDRLFSGDLFKDIRSMFALFFRLAFIVLEAWAFSRLCGWNLFSFLKALRYFENLINFMCFLCIACVVIYNFLHFKASAKSSHIFNRIKCFFTLNILFAGVIYHFCAKGSYAPDAVSIILYYIAPIMMFLDWLLFDTHSNIRAQDPLIWISFPILYFCIVLIISHLGVVSLYPMLVGIGGFAKIGMFTVGLIIMGYIFYLIDRFIKGR